MKSKNIQLIIVLMSLALIGVTGMQYFFLVESYDSKSKLFDRNVYEALNELTKKTEKFEDISLLQNKLEEEYKKLKNSGNEKQTEIDFQIRQLEDKIDEDFERRNRDIMHEFPLSIVITNDIYETYFRERDPKKLNKISIQDNTHDVVEDNGMISRNVIRELFVTDPEPLKKAVNTDTIYYLIDINPVVGRQVIAMPRINPILNASLKKLQEKQQAEKKERLKKIALYEDSLKIVRSGAQTTIFDDLAKESKQANIPIEQRIREEYIDTILKAELLSKGINLPYNYKVTLSNSDSVIFHHISNTDINFTENTAYTALLFPKEVMGASAKLMLTFSNKNSYIMQNMGVILVSSAGLLLILIGCFAYTIFIIFRQKKISEMKTDFINNMTHEFKTPVATIMIASEALKDPEVTEDEQRIKKLANIIYDENVRLGNHIERVLNIAKIDRDDLKLEHKDIEMNDLISAVVDSMELQLQKNQSRIVLDLKASNAMVKGDELHLSNVLYNLIDNAIKYTTDVPEINISTYNSGNNLVIRVKDNGIGMNRDQLSKIFEQFYRIPTGNVHDVKGFGLGLSYVSNIIKLLHGEIHVRSEKNKGSEFEMIFRAA